MGSVSQLDQDDPHIAGHCHKHFPKALGLGLGMTLEL